MTMSRRTTTWSGAGGVCASVGVVQKQIVRGAIKARRWMVFMPTSLGMYKPQV